MLQPDIVTMRAWCAMGMIAVCGVGCPAGVRGGGDELVQVEQHYGLDNSAVVELASFEHGVGEPFTQPRREEGLSSYTEVSILCMDTSAVRFGAPMHSMCRPIDCST